MPLLFSSLISFRRSVVPATVRAVFCVRACRSLAVLAVAAAFTLLSPPAHAQALNTGTVAGNVTDAQGGIVPNAVATLTAPDQNKVLTVRVNAKGEYVFSDVAAGNYILRVIAPTFSAYSVPDVEVNADQNIRIDAKLSAGGASETVTVEAPSQTVDTRSATIATVIDNKLVEDLPIDGNNVVSLAALLPGVTNVNAPTTFTSDTGGPTYNVSGSRSNQNLFLLDGLLWNNNYYNTGLNFPPPFMLNELSVQLNNFKAQYGRNAGSVFNALTRVGTNSIHGTVWEYIQNSALDAADYIYQRNPHLVQNQFGVTVGGPIKRDKAFFFGGIQVLRSAGEVVAAAATPTLAERGQNPDGSPHACVTPALLGLTCGTYTAVLATGAKPPTASSVAAGTTGVKNPLGASNTYAASALAELQSTQAAIGNGGNNYYAGCIMKLKQLAVVSNYLPNAEIPTECFNPVSVTVINNYLPLPTVFPPAVMNGKLPFAVTSAKQPRNEYDGLMRFDYVLNHAHTLDARTYITNADDDTSNSSTSGVGVPTYEIDNNFAAIISANIGDTWVVNANSVNVLRFGYKRYSYSIVPTDTTTGAQLGADLQQKGYGVLPRIEAASNRFTLGSANSTNSYSLNANYELDDTYTHIRGNHVFQVGAQYLNLDYIHRYDQEPVLEAEDQNTGISIGDFVLGLPFDITIGNTTNISAKQHALYFYGQDDWRATSRLTLNLGLRYELPFNWYQPDGQSLTFINGFQSQVFPNAPVGLAYNGDPGVSKGIIPTKFANLAPRFGLAYDVAGNGRTAIRAGFGIFYDNLNANTVGIGQPYHYQSVTGNGLGSFSNPTLGLAAVPANYTDAAHAQFVSPSSVNFADANVTTPYVMSFNVGIQQKIGKGSLEANYIGKLGRHQIIPFDENPAIYDCSGSYFQANPTLYCPVASSASAQISSYQARIKYPQFNYGGQGVVDNATIATSNYNGLQFIYIQRTRKSLTTTASYTYSRSIDEQSSGTTNTANVPTYNIRDNYGPSDFQATHVFNMGWVYKLPDVRNGNLTERVVLNNWTFSGTYAIRSGNPFTVTISGDRALTDSRTQRAQIFQPQLGIAGNPHRHRVDKVNQWFNVEAFRDPNSGTCAVTAGGCQTSADCATGQPAGCTYVYGQPKYGTYGNVGRNSIYGPAYTEVDLRLIRQIPIREGINGEFRVDAFNAFNTPNLAQPQASFSASSALGVGQILNTVGRNGTATTNGRRVQLSLIVHY